MGVCCLIYAVCIFQGYFWYIKYFGILENEIQIVYTMFIIITQQHPSLFIIASYLKNGYFTPCLYSLPPSLHCVSIIELRILNRHWHLKLCRICVISYRVENKVSCIPKRKRASFVLIVTILLALKNKLKSYLYLESNYLKKRGRGRIWLVFSLQ